MSKFAFQATALLALTIFSHAAGATELSLSFDTLANGAVYPCNAGLMHQADTFNTREDTMHYSYRTWTHDAGNESGSWSENTSIRTVGAGTNAYNRAVNYNAQTKTAENPFDTHIDTLVFNLASEHYGACYHIDACFRGPQIEYFAKHIPASVSLFANATITHDNGLSYQRLANPQVRGIVHCDTQGAGIYQYAHNRDGKYGSFDNDINWNEFDKRSDKADVSLLSNFSDNATTISGQLATNSPNYPRFCTVRYEFCEQSKTERAAENTDANIRIKTIIEEN